jgi:hypothetical protein
VQSGDAVHQRHPVENIEQVRAAGKSDKSVALLIQWTAKFFVLVNLG